MSEPSLEHVDVSDMLCAQALALVAKAIARVTMGESIKVRLNSEDVRQDLQVWASEKGCLIREISSEELIIKRTK